MVRLYSGDCIESKVHVICVSIVPAKKVTAEMDMQVLLFSQPDMRPASSTNIFYSGARLASEIDSRVPVTPASIDFYRHHLHKGLPLTLAPDGYRTYSHKAITADH